MHSALSKIWTWVTNSIYNNNYHNAKHTTFHTNIFLGLAPLICIIKLFFFGGGGIFYLINFLYFQIDTFDKKNA